MLLRQLRVVKSTRVLSLQLFILEMSDDSGWGAHDETAGWNAGPRSYDGACSHKGAFSNLGTIQDDGADSDQSTICDATAVDDGAMADGDFITEDRGKAITRDVQHAAILDIGPRANANHVDVGTEHAAVPDARILSEFDVADQRRSGGYPRAGVESRNLVLKGENPRFH